MNETAIFLSRIQFAFTAMYHFLFVPLTIGLVWLLAVMETTYVITQKKIWKDMTLFWGKLFGINFAMGVATGITLEFQFGTNWAYYSHYIGDIFGPILALEGMMAFFLEATLIGLFFYGWNRLSKKAHMIVTWILAIATTMSAFWILIANAWMQHPIGSFFNPETMRMELSSFSEIVFNKIAQVKFCHTVSSGHITGAIFVMSISAYYLLKKRYIELARRSLYLSVFFGFFNSLLLIFMGDESGYEVFQNQPMKGAALEGMWKTEEAPAGFTLFGWPDQKEEKNYYSIKIPYIMGIIGTRSLTKKISGIHDIVLNSKKRIENGVIAYKALQEKDFKTLKAYEKDLGYALLLKTVYPDVIGASKEHINRAAKKLIPQVFPLFWCFRIMVGIGFFIFFLFSFHLYYLYKKKEPKFLLKLSLYSLPFPWIAAQMGWFVAEHGRQPWAIQHILPTNLAASATQPSSVWVTIIIFFIFYTFLAISDIYLMKKIIKNGPSISIR